MTKIYQQTPFNYSAHRRAHQDDDLEGTGIRSVTLIVAAHDSAPTSIEKADYVCSGTNDQLTIQQALNDLPQLIAGTAGAESGQVRLMEGNYYVSGGFGTTSYFSESLSDPGQEWPGWWLSGQGPGTRIVVSDGTNASFDIVSATGDTAAAPHIKITSLTIDGNQTNQSSGTIRGIALLSSLRARLEGVTVQNCSGDGYYGTATSVMEGCRAWGNTGHGFNFRGGDYHLMTGCISQNNTGSGIYLAQGGGSFNRIVGCIVDHNTGDGISVYDDKTGIYDCSTYRNETVGIYVLANNCIVSSNHSVNNGHEGIYLANSQNCLVIGNYLDSNGRTTSTTYAQIRVAGGASQYNFLIGNSCVRQLGTGVPKYGIWDEVTSIGDFVFGNELYNAGVTSDLQIDSLTAIEECNRITSGFTGADAKPHKILSTVHSDTNAADVPAIGDVLTWTGTQWDAEPAAGGSGSKTFAFFT